MYKYKIIGKKKKRKRKSARPCRIACCTRDSSLYYVYGIMDSEAVQVATVQGIYGVDIFSTPLR